MAWTLLQLLAAGEMVLFAGLVISVFWNWASGLVRKAPATAIRGRANAGWSARTLVVACVVGLIFLEQGLLQLLPPETYSTSPRIFSPHEPSQISPSLAVDLVNILEYLKLDLKQPADFDARIEATTNAFVGDVQAAFTRHRTVVSTLAAFKTEALEYVVAAVDSKGKNAQPMVKLTAVDKRVAEVKKHAELCQAAVSKLADENTGSAIRVQRAVNDFRATIHAEQARRDAHGTGGSRSTLLQQQTSEGLANVMNVVGEAQDKLSSIGELYDGDQELCLVDAVPRAVAGWKEVVERAGTIKNKAELQDTMAKVRAW
ncbi:uncharacterized protein RCC_02265 [Ramularia collo-cygni]|uniref:Uncharacterized protein n=1 Tax=Ramularia collo-cygni TaxID=112498 RepID=A0A2D3UMF0_9PEZI|nr:uncharacterized protein RCC_02265 [Ramularia collo-cygni]CZT16422.1 uncharacterized protein RCC_02265 [Ramularia collo-cygni]